MLALALVVAPALTPRPEPVASAAPGPLALTLLAAPADDDAWLRLAGPSVVRIVVPVPDQNAEAVGTGVVLTAGGEILTNNHVITGGSGIRVTVLGGDGGSYRATVVGTNRALDIAVLQLTGATGLTAAHLAPGAPVRPGERVAAVGAPDGDATVAAGTVIGLHRIIQTRRDSLSGRAERLTGLIEVAADIEQGDSGGPLLNPSGQVIGLTVAATVTHGTGDPGGSGFAIPIGTALSAAHRILAAR